MKPLNGNQLKWLLGSDIFIGNASKYVLGGPSEEDWHHPWRAVFGHSSLTTTAGIGYLCAMPKVLTHIFHIFRFNPGFIPTTIGS